MEWWLIVIIAISSILITLVGIVLVRTLRFKPKEEQQNSYDEVQFDHEKAVTDLANMLRIKTISSRNKSEEDENEFRQFEQLLFKSFPQTAKKCEFQKLGERSLLFRWKGESDEKPTVLMSHYDVVTVVPDGWTHNPFGGEIIDGELWGRGALDTKGTLNGVMQAVETLIKQGFTPKNDIYMAFAGDEEIAGTGATTIIDEFVLKNIKPELVVDEGGAVVNNVFPGVNKPCALVGIAEKGMTDLQFTVKSNGGHASAPPAHTTVGRVAQACVKIENNPSTFTLSVPVKKMFDTLGRHSTFAYRMIFANLWLFRPILNSIAKKKGGEINALIRTTCAFTQMSGSKAPNVMANEAKMVANYRIITGDSVEQVVARAKKVVKDKDIEIKPLMGVNPSVISNTDCDGYKIVEESIKATWGCIVSPYLMVACSDSRHYGRITDKVYRFSAMALTNEERATIHGNNERVKISEIYKTVEFYIRLIQNC